MGLSGILEVKATTHTHSYEIKEETYGPLLVDNTIGLHHNHFLAYRLNLDIDDVDNSWVKHNLVTKTVDNNITPRKS